MKLIKKILAFLLTAFVFVNVGSFYVYGYCDWDDNSDLDADEAYTDPGSYDSDTSTLTTSDGTTYSYDHTDYSENDSTATSLTSRVNETAEILDEAKNSGDPTAIAAAQAAYDEAKAALDEFCNTHPNYASIYDASGFATTVNTMTGTFASKEFIGDPVKLSTGEFSIQDFDVPTTFFGRSYKITRNYRTHGTSDGVFGNGWSSNLDIRLVHCTANDLSESIAYYENWKSELDVKKEKIEGYLAEEEEDVPKVQEMLDDFMELYNTCVSDLEKFKATQEKTEYYKQFQKYTNYGELAEASRTLGNNIVLFEDESGIVYVFESEDVDDVFYPKTANIYFERLDFDDESQTYAMNCKNGDRLFFDKFGLHTKTEYANSITLEKKYEFDGEEKIAGVKIAIDGKNLYTIKFDSNQKITSIESLDEKNIYGYNALGLLSSVTDQWNNTRSFEYNEKGFLTRQIFADGTFRTVAYDENGKVKSVTDENGSTEYFAYDTENRITYYTDRDGIKSEYHYDENLNTIREIYADGDAKTFEYNEKNQVVRRNRVSGYETLQYDENGKIIKITDANGKTQEFIYLGENLVALKDKDDLTLYFEHDARGNTTSLSNGKETVFRAEYNGNDLLISRTDCRNNTTRFNYDENGNVTKQTIFDSKGNLISAEEKFYDSKNRLVRIKKADGKIIDFTYGTNGSLTAKFSDGLKVEYEYNKRGRLIRETETDTFTGKKRETIFTYDKTGNLLSKSVNGTKTMGWSYSAGGTLIQSVIYGEKTWKTNFEIDSEKGTVSSIKEAEIDGFGNTISLQTTSTRFEKTSSGSQSIFVLNDGRQIIQKFNDNGNLVEKLSNTLSNGSATRTMKSVYNAAFSSESRVVSESDAKGFGGEYLFGYEGFGRLSFATENGKNATGISNELKTEYYADGKILSTTDSSGIRTTWTYDGLGNVIEKRNEYTIFKAEYTSAGRISKTEIYDAKTNNLVWKAEYKYGNWTSEKERWIETTVGGKIKTKIYFNAWGEAVSKIDGNGSTSFEYDDFGNCVKTIFESGITIFSKYDGRGLLIEQKTVGKSGSALTSKYEYNFNGKLVASYNNSHLVYKAKYDSMNRIIFEHSSPFAKYSAKNYEYDEFDRIVKITLGDETVPSQNRILFERCEYGENGNPKIVRYDAKGTARTITTDGFGRILNERNRLGDSQKFLYDKSGAISEKLDFENKRTSLSGSERKLKSETVFFDGTKTEIFYDSMGRISRAKNNDSDFTYKYDLAGFLTSVKDEKKSEEVQYFYNEQGQRTEIKGEQTHVKYYYGKNGWLSSVLDVREKTEVKFVYDDLGRETLKIWSDGKSQKYLYDDEGRRIATCGFDSRQSPIFFDGAVYDENGFKVLKITGDGSITRYEYDDFARLSKAVYPYSESLENHIQNELSENGIFFHTGNISHEERISLTQSEKSAAEKTIGFIGLGAPNLKIYENTLFEKFIYDENGNLTVKETPYAKITYKYDAEDRLISIGNNGTSSYDKNGNLVSQKNSWKEKFFEYNAQNRMKKAGVDDLRNGERTTYDYSYDGFGRRLEEVSTTGGRRFFYDGLSLKKLYSSPIIFGSIADDSSQKRDATRALKSEQSATSSDRYAWFYEEDVSTKSASNGNRRTFDGYTRYVFGNDASPLMSFTEGSISEEKEKYSLFEDLGGSVCKVATERGNSYDANYTGFGSIYETDFPTSQSIFFIGKDYNNNLESFDFGYRDYDARQGRFQTVDPIRDGANWYAYCGGNPISFFDPNGLEIMTISIQGYMQDPVNVNVTINGTDVLVTEKGCVCQMIATTINTFYGLKGEDAYTAATIATTLSSVFDEKNNPSNMIISTTLENYGFSIVADTGQNAKTEKIIDLIENAKEAKTGMIVVGQVTTGYGVDAKGNAIPDHYVFIEDIVYETRTKSWDEMLKDFAHGKGLHATETKAYAVIAGTSKHDSNWSEKNKRNDRDWVMKNNKSYVSVKEIGRVMTIQKTGTKFNAELKNLLNGKSCEH